MLYLCVTKLLTGELKVKLLVASICISKIYVVTIQGKRLHYLLVIVLDRTTIAFSIKLIILLLLRYIFLKRHTQTQNDSVHSCNEQTKKYHSLPSQGRANIGKKGLCRTSHIVRSLNQEICLKFKDGISRIYTPMNNNNLTSINTSKKLVKWPQLW